MHRAVLTDLKSGKMEAEGLGLPDDVLKLTVGLPGRADSGERRLHEPEVANEILRPVVGEASGPGP